MKGCADFAGPGNHHGFRFGGHIGDHARHARLENARLLRRDGCERRTKVFLMVQPDGSNHANLWRANIRGIKSSTEAGLEDRDVDLAGSELQQRCGRNQFEERGSTLRILSTDGRVMRPELFGAFYDGRIRQRLAINLDAFTDGNQVWASVEPGAATLRALNRLDHRGGRALAVGARDMETRRRALGMVDSRG